MTGHITGALLLLGALAGAMWLVGWAWRPTGKWVWQPTGRHRGDRAPWRRPTDGGR